MAAADRTADVEIAGAVADRNAVERVRIVRAVQRTMSTGRHRAVYHRRLTRKGPPTPWQATPILLHQA